MMDAQARIERRLRFGGILLISGLAMQVLTLLWNHPLSFLAFMFVASPLVLAGIVIYFSSIPLK
jgi:uncharacterized membrane protein